MSYEVSDDFHLFHEVVSKYFAHICWRDKHVGEDRFARVSFLHDSLQAFQLPKVLEFVALRDGKSATTSIFFEDRVLVDEEGLRR